MHVLSVKTSCEDLHREGYLSEYILIIFSDVQFWKSHIYAAFLKGITYVLMFPDDSGVKFINPNKAKSLDLMGESTQAVLP